MVMWPAYGVGTTGRVARVSEQDETGTPSAKGRPTPSRKEAEAARKARMKKPMTRKEQMQRERKLREERRSKQREALATGKGDYLPVRDRGPVRAMVRDFVDRRLNVAEFLLPVLLVILALSFVPQAWAQAIVLGVWPAMILGMLLDEIIMVFQLKRELRRRFTDGEKTKGTTFYAVLRTTQMRRWRLPKPVIGRGQPLRDHYS